MPCDKGLQENYILLQQMSVLRVFSKRDKGYKENFELSLLLFDFCYSGESESKLVQVRLGRTTCVSCELSFFLNFLKHVPIGVVVEMS